MGWPGPVLRVIAVVSVAANDHRGPAATFGGGKIEIVFGAHVEPTRSHGTWRDIEIDRVPSKVAVLPHLRALEASFRAVVALCNGHVQDGPPVGVPTSDRGRPDDPMDTAGVNPTTALPSRGTCPKSWGCRRPSAGVTRSAAKGPGGGEGFEPPKTSRQLIVSP